jgi:hypothetical protein
MAFAKPLRGTGFSKSTRDDGQVKRRYFAIRVVDHSPRHLFTDVISGVCGKPEVEYVAQSEGYECAASVEAFSCNLLFVHAQRGASLAE